MSSSVSTFLVFENTGAQAKIAIDCLDKALGKYLAAPAPDKLTSDLLPYLIHACVLLFLVRDQRAFLQIHQSPVFGKLRLADRLRQLPTLNQLQAVLKARQNDAEWQQLDVGDLQLIESLGKWEDVSLGVTELKAFRDQLLINGVPAQETTSKPFPVPGFDYASLCHQTVAAWKRL